MRLGAKRRSPAGQGGARRNDQRGRSVEEKTSRSAGESLGAAAEPEFVHDGRQHIGSIVAGHLGFEIFDADDQFLACVETLSEARSRLHSAHRTALIRVGAAR